MEKIKRLLKQIGASEELADTISEEIVKYTDAVKQQSDVEYRNKCQQANVICVEEVQKEKAMLAKKVSLYLESKKDRIEESIREQRENESSEAGSLLKKVRSLLEGIDIETGNPQELQELQAGYTRLSKAVNTLSEENKTLTSKAIEAVKIANVFAEQNKVYETVLRKEGLMESVKSKEEDENEDENEDEKAKGAKKSKKPDFLKKESRQRSGRTIAESRRRSSKPLTSRSSATTATKATKATNVNDIQQIANLMEK